MDDRSSARDAGKEDAARKSGQAVMKPWVPGPCMVVNHPSLPKTDMGLSVLKLRDSQAHQDGWSPQGHVRSNHKDISSYHLMPEACSLELGGRSKTHIRTVTISF